MAKRKANAAKVEEKAEAEPASQPALRLEWLSPAELAENPRNWRTHPEAQLSSLTDAIAEVGWAGACLYNERTQRLIDGHARRKVALDQGTAKIPVLIGDWDEATEAKILATLDPLAAMAEADKGKLDALLREVQTGSEALGAMLTELAEKAKVYELPAGEADGGSIPDADADDAATEIDEDFEEDDLDLLFKSPYPWFGGKSRVAGIVWKRFGDVRSYIEPFFGSGAVFLNRPQPFSGNETVNDFDGLVSNFWRAVKADPDKVADYADWPVNENDLHARHAWLLGQKEGLVPQLEGDPDWFDAKVAGWWCWGMACWIGAGFCKGDGPWQIVEQEDGSRQLVHLSGAGQGVNRQLVHLSGAGQGVNRQLVHLSGAGQGVNRQLVEEGGEGVAGLGERGLLEWMRALSQRLQRVRVCCGDWTRICGGRSGDAITHFFSTGEPVGVFLDPPYKLDLEEGANRGACYNTDGEDTNAIAEAVRQWCIAHGDDPQLRIALCGYEGEHKMPATWECVKWKAHGGMAGLSADPNSAGKVNRFRERLWFSPACLKRAEADGLAVEKAEERPPG